MSSLETATHLVVFQHGLLGSQHDFDRFLEVFRQLQADGLYLHAAVSNASGLLQTYDGVDRGGERLADEIEALARQMPRLAKLSMVGHSLGGLYSRYCAGELLSRGFFDKVAPVNFVTLATPHLGIRRSHRHVTNVMFNGVMTKIFGRTGQQLTLTDEADEKTLQLSKTLTTGSRNYHPAWSDMEDELLASIRASKADVETPFELRKCVITAHTLQIFEQSEPNARVEIDLVKADVNVRLPASTPNDDAGFFSSFIGSSRRSSDEEDAETTGNVDVEIRWPSAGGHSLCVLRIPEEDVPRDWRWLVALSNSTFGVRCETSEQKGTEKRPEVTTPPLLSCLTRGQFLQALQMFQARTLYSSVFFDMQVPYTCAAIRAFNPYRQDVKETLLSPIYTHIVLDSLKNARKLRDTLPLRLKRLALKYVRPHHQALASPSSDDAPSLHDIEKSASSVSSTSTRNGRRHASEPHVRSPPSSSERSGVFHSRRRGKTMGSTPSRSFSTRPGDKARAEPFEEGQVILDQLQYAFTSDFQQDELRGMLLSVQSVGWRRIDVLFGSMMAHEHIIAKRAKHDKPLDSGIDVVHHVMDTFML